MRRARSFAIDIDGNRITYQFASEEEQLALDIAVEGWTAEALVLWLDRQVRQMDIHQSELLKWLRQLVDHLLNTRGMTIAALMRCKFLLAKKTDNKIAGHSPKATKQRLSAVPLGATEANVATVSFDTSLYICGQHVWGATALSRALETKQALFRPGSRSRL